MVRPIMPECYADTLLVQKLVPVTLKATNHKHSCFEVEKAMKHGAFKNSFAIGIIDNDKRQIKYLEDGKKIKELEDSLILWKHNSRDHYIIQICPGLEKWVLRICEIGEIDISIYGIEPTLEGIKFVTKSSSSIYDVKLNSLFSQIGNRTDIKDVRVLKKWIELLLEKTYYIDENEFINE
jgi:hypothetical protein